MKKLSFVGISGLVALFAASSANAALPAALGTSMSAIETDALAAVDLGWPIVLSITGAFVLFRIVKRIIRGF